MPKQLIFGTAGIPLSTADRNTPNGIERVKELGLGAMELEFVRSVNISKDKAPEVKKVAEQNNIVLTCHGSYFINLNSREKAKLNASKQRILQAADILYRCGGYSLCFHSGFYQKHDAGETYKYVKKQLGEIANNLKHDSNKIWIRPEVTGKFSQFGTVEEILNLSHEIEQVMPCIDFSHQHAKTGKYNSYDEFAKILEMVEKKLGRRALENMHIHVSGIEYTGKGERRHLNLNESDFNYKELLKALKDFKVRGVLISESPNIEEDSLLMQKAFKGLK